MYSLHIYMHTVSNKYDWQLQQICVCHFILVVDIFQPQIFGPVTYTLITHTHTQPPLSSPAPVLTDILITVASETTGLHKAPHGNGFHSPSVQGDRAGYNRWQTCGSDLNQSSKVDQQLNQDTAPHLQHRPRIKLEICTGTAIRGSKRAVISAGRAGLPQH